MIKNDFQFKIYFYNYLAACNMVPNCIELEYYERILKDYLMYYGYNHVRDLDLLLGYFNEKGEI